jgi:predicted transcriptional regulator
MNTPHVATDTASVHIRLPRDLVEQIDQRAIELERTRSWLIRQAVRRAFDPRREREQEQHAP